MPLPSVLSFNFLGRSSKCKMNFRFQMTRAIFLPVELRISPRVVGWVAPVPSKRSRATSSFNSRGTPAVPDAVPQSSRSGRTQRRFSLSVRMNRSAQPLPSGARTKAGELSMPSKATSFWKWCDMYWIPWSCGMERPRAMRLGEPAEVASGRPAGSARAPRSGLPVNGRGCRRIQRSNDRRRRTPRPDPRQ